MSSHIKNLNDLKDLRKSLKVKKEAEEKADQERRKREAAAMRDADLFRRSVGDVVRLPSDDKIFPAAPPPQPVARERLADEEAALKASLSDEFSVEALLDADAALSYSRPGVGTDVVRKLRKGHWPIQDQLDLHGLRRDDARDLVADFLEESRERGMRCVRIIHGKGLGSANQEPVLKKMVLSWLAQKEEVIAFCQAKVADGGSGAVVVLLKGR
jgi:DNA-nicking Smr family endonuclease